MLAAGIIAVLFVVALFAFWRMGRSNAEKNQMKRDAATREKVNEILQKQRDDRIVGVDGADRLFDTFEKD